MDNSKLTKQYILLLTLEGFAGILILASMALAARNLSNLDYSLLLTFRRDAAFLVPLVLLGLGTTLVKEIAILNASYKRGNQSINSIINGGLLLSLCSFSTLLFFFIFSESFRDFFSGNNALMLIWLFCLGLNAIIFSILRGQGRYFIATLSNFLNLGFAPFIASIFCNSFISFLMINLYLMSGFIIFFLIISLKKIYYPRLSFASSNYLFRSGFHRFLADLAFNFIIWSPIFIGRIILNVNDEIYFGAWSFALMILTIFVQLIFPMTTIALPEMSRSIVSGDKGFALKSLAKVIFLIIIFSLLVQIIYLLIGNKILLIIFGQVSQEYLFQVSLIVLALPGFLIYSLNRAIIDAIYDSPVNLIITSISSALIIFGAIFLKYILDMSSLVEYIFPSAILLMGLSSIIAIFGRIRLI